MAPSRARAHDISAHAEHVFTTVAGCIVRRVDHISNPNNHGDDRWDTVYAKLNLWAMVEFKKVHDTRARVGARAVSGRRVQGPRRVVTHGFA